MPALPFRLLCVVVALVLVSLTAWATAADVKPLVLNGSGYQQIQPGQTLYCPLSSGLASAKPAAAAANVGQVYWATDTATLYRSNGTTWDALTAASSPSGSAGGDLGSTYPNPTVLGLQGGALPSTVAGAFLKRNAGNTAWEVVGFGSSANTVTQGNDARLSDARAPNGAAGGSLAGTYPNPTLGSGVVTDTNVASANKDGVAATPSLRTLGTGAQQATAGNDSRLTNSRAPTGSATGDLSATYPAPTVAKINGATLGTTTATDGNLLIGSGTQWNTKTVSGDATITGNGVVSLAATGTAGTYRSVTTDAQGRVTAGTNPTTLAGYAITDAIKNAGSAVSVQSGAIGSRPAAGTAGRIYLATDTRGVYVDNGATWDLYAPALTGDVTATAGLTATTLANSGVSAGTYGDGTHVGVVTVDAKGRVTSATSTAITASGSGIVGVVPLASGGTGANLSGTGGTGQVVKQASSGAVLTVGALANADLPTSGVGAGTYQGITLNSKGVATNASALTTIAGYGITDAVSNAGATPSIAAGVLASRPVAAVNGRIYVATDTGALYRDTGSGWSLLLPVLSGDLTTSGTVATLAATGTSAGSFGDATHVPAITVDAKGRLTAAASTAIALPASAITSGTLPVARGGTGQTAFTDGQLLIGSTAGGTLVPAQLTAGDGVTIVNDAGSITISAPGGGSAVTSVNTRTGAVVLAATDIPVFLASGTGHAVGAVPDPGGSAGATKYLREDATWAIPAGGGGGSGTVTSAALTMPAIFSVAGSPITTSGTFAATLATQSPNIVWAGPVSGSAAAPTFRALVSADIPSLNASKITAGTLGAALGGTGLDGSAAANGKLLIGNGSGYTLATLTAGSGMTVTNGAGTITLASTGGGVASVNTRTGSVVLNATDIPTMVASGGSHAGGAVPDPGSSSGTVKYLREDATWATPPGSVTIAAARVAYATSTNTLGGSANMTYGAGANSANALILAGDPSLEVHNTSTGGYMQFTAHATNGNWLQFSKDATPSTGVSIGNNTPGNAAGDNLIMATYASSAWTRRLTIVNSTGAVLVNTATDNGTDKLQVSGSLSSSGAATIGGAAFVNGASADGTHALIVNGAILTDSSQTTRAPLRMPHGTAPTSPVNGDVWTTTAGLYARINGSTVGPLAAASGGTYAPGSNAQLDLSTMQGSTTYGGLNITASTSQASPSDAFGIKTQLNYPTGAGLTTGTGVYIGAQTGSTACTQNTGLAIESPPAIGGGAGAAAISIGAAPITYSSQFTILSTDTRPSHFAGTLETEDGLKVKEGTNKTMGVAVLVGGTVTVSTTKVTANSRIFLTGQNLGTITVPVGYAVSARTAATSFTILSANAIDTSSVAWMIVEPSP